MVGEVCTAVDAAVSAVTGGKVGLEGFGARHGEHRRALCTLHEGAAGPRRLTRETTQHTREGRGGAWGGTHTPVENGRSLHMFYFTHYTLV